MKTQIKMVKKVSLATRIRRASGMVWLVVLWAVAPTAGRLAAAGPEPSFEIQGNTLQVRAEGQTFDVSLRSPRLLLDDATAVAETAPSGTSGTLSDGKTLEVSYPPIDIGNSATIEAKLFLRWSQEESLLRKWARLRLVGAESKLLNEVVLDRIDQQGHPVATYGRPGKDGKLIFGTSGNSHPVFMPGIFVGIEFPSAWTRCEEGQIVLAHRPGIQLQPGAWYETRTAVYGVAPAGEEVQAFHRYIASHRPKPHGLHVSNNSWWTLPFPEYTEKDVLDLAKVWEEKLWKAHGVALDSFCIDYGWSDKESIWEISHKVFPTGFTNFLEAVQRMHSEPGLWISPSSLYPGALDGEWAKAHGYETRALPGMRTLCLGGPRYAEQFKKRLADMVSQYGVCHVKLDGMLLECPETDHGHQPGPFSCEAIAEGMIAALEAARKANPKVWLETTCFGATASPWWLFHANSLIGMFGDDSPAGRVPSPVYRESATSARDFYNLQSAWLWPIPINSQEVLGITHQSPDPMLNDAVVVVMRGNMFLPLYINPKCMNDARWDDLARLLTWARKNEATLDQTVPLLPASWQTAGVPAFTDDADMPREPYGYAHVKNDSGLIMLRNPWIAPQSYTLKLDGSLGFSSAARNLSAVSLYPEPRLYGTGLNYGDTLDVALAPYETIVLAVNTDQELDALPQASAAIRSQLKVSECECQLQRVEFAKTDSLLGPDWTCPLGDSASGVRLTGKADVDVAAPKAELLILYEGKEGKAGVEKLPLSVCQVTVNGRTVEPATMSSEGSWCSAATSVREHWTFTRVPLSTGKNAIAFEQLVGDGCTRMSAWVWATKPGSTSAYPNALPQPECISLDGVALLDTTEVSDLAPEAVPVERPVERINGVFLDALEPVSVAQGEGTLQKNRSRSEKPLAIGGRPFLRGLGTHAPSTIVYSLDGKYRRFQAWAGGDSNVWPTVTFEILVDGVRKWHCGRMEYHDAPVWIDLDVSQAKTLTLVVGDAGDATSDHADWADARLLQ